MFMSTSDHADHFIPLKCFTRKPYECFLTNTILFSFKDDFQLAKEKDSAFKINESDETIPLLPPMEGENQFGFDTAALKGNELISGYEKLATLNTQTGVAFLKDIDATVTAEDLAVMMQTVNDTNNNDNQTLP